MIFRFDDVCINSSMELHNQMTDFLLKRFPQCEVIWAVSPITHSTMERFQRVFPKEWNALSDHRTHYLLDSMGLPEYRDDVSIATHGLVHVDHRLLSKETQELSIILSAELTGASIFVPPFNKWNKDTEAICSENNLILIKYEMGWKSMEYNIYDPSQEWWYLHAREWTIDSFIKWFE